MHLKQLHSQIKQLVRINSASNFEISIKETANLIADIMGKNIQLSSENERKRPENSKLIDY